MESKITTARLEDLLKIFDPAVQEIEDTGGARILYTFNESDQPERQRVGETFILDVADASFSFFVSAPIDDFISAGTIMPAESLEGVEDRYSLSEEDITQLISDVSIALSLNSEEQINSLLEE